MVDSKPKHPRPPSGRLTFRLLAAPWDLQRVVHLHRRAGFAATWERDAARFDGGPEASVDAAARRERRAWTGCRRISIRSRRSSAMRRSLRGMRAGSRRGGSTAAVFARSARRAADARCGTTTSPPATSRSTTCRHAAAERDVPRIGPAHSSASCCAGVVHDPALLVWLDAPANRKEHPNENLGRELMELFTLGIGHFTEADVKEAARAADRLDGVGRGGIPRSRRTHDDGEKTILGTNGNVERRRSRARCCSNSRRRHAAGLAAASVFCGEESATRQADRRTGRRAAGDNLDIGWGVETILRSEAFFADANLGTTDPRGRPSSWSAPCAPWSCSIRRRARWSWPNGSRGSGRTCSIRPTSSAGPVAASWITSRARWWPRPTSPRPSSRAGVGGRTEPLDVAPILQRQGRGDTRMKRSRSSAISCWGRPVEFAQGRFENGARLVEGERSGYRPPAAVDAVGVAPDGQLG